MQEFFRIDSPTLYFQSSDGWRMHVAGTGLHTTPARVADEEADRLYTAAVGTIHEKLDVFYGVKDRIPLVFSLVPEESAGKVMLRLDITRNGIGSIILDNPNFFLAFALVLFVVSILIGSFLARRFAKPLIRLSREAEKVAEGEYGRAFTLRRRDEIGSLSKSLSTMAQNVEEQLNEVRRRAETMETMNKIDKAVLSSTSRADLLDRVIGFVGTQYSRSTVALVLQGEGSGSFEVTSILRHGESGLFKERPEFSIQDLGTDFAGKLDQVFQVSGRKRRNGIPPAIDRIFDEKIGCLLNVPITLNDRFLGCMLIMRRDADEFEDRDVESLAMLADQVGVALQSVQAVEEKEGLFLGTLIALTRTIDAKSKWTAGHSERVARYCEQMGEALGLDDEELRLLSMSAILHDIGKIGVPEAVLDKPGRLTEDEYDLIKTHPERGVLIIKDIPTFERIGNGVLDHHERWDGSGYPGGKSGEEISLFGRIIAVADVYDAVTYERPYRKGMTAQEARDFMLGNKGVMFESRFVDLFLDLPSFDMHN